MAVILRSPTVARLSHLSRLFSLISILSIGAIQCGGRAVPDLSARFYSVHAAMQASGLTQVGTVSRGFLDSSQVATIPLQATNECLAIVALGDSGVADIALTVVDAQGTELASDDTIGPDASLRYCPAQTGKQTLRVTMAKGSGGYAVSIWSGGAPSGRLEGSSGSGSQFGGGTCADPAVIVDGQTYVGDTRRGTSREEGTCAGCTGPELVYRLDLPMQRRVTIEVAADFDSVLYVRRGDCEDSSAEVACNDDEAVGGRRGSKVDEVLEPGTYYVFVDGYGSQDAGEYRMTVRLRTASAGP
ncbi:MAG: hypothetical protein FWD57_10090 [Polyangiaceae bacterium]|nr:hypothetical protein [Polyangiaceae bacterium]